MTRAIEIQINTPQHAPLDDRRALDSFPNAG